jgi:putative FmdB family regulatory protein
MPIYEYHCSKCETDFEVEQRITDNPVKTCPQCRSRKVKRLISQTSFVLKGGGWYSDLYSSAGASDKKESADGASSSSDSSSPSDSSSGSKSDKKDSSGPDKGKKKGKKGAKAAA